MADLEAATEAIKADPRHGSRMYSKYVPQMIGGHTLEYDFWFWVPVHSSITPQF